MYPPRGHIFSIRHRAGCPTPPGKPSRCGSLRVGSANWNFTYLDNGNVNFPDNKKYSRSKPTIIRIPPTTLMPIRLTLLFFIILFAKTNSSAPTTIIKTDINGYMSFLLSNSDLPFLNQPNPTPPGKAFPLGGRWRGTRRMREKCPEGSPSSVTCGDSFPQRGKPMLPLYPPRHRSPTNGNLL